MPNKPVLMPLDKTLRQKHPIRGFTNGGTNCKITVEFKQGFELFNTREYHNYETWSDGYYIKYEDVDSVIYAQGEDLDEALNDLNAKLINPRPYDVRKKEEVDASPYWARNNQP